MNVEEKLDDAVSDLEHLIACGKDFQDAVAIAASENGFSVAGLLSELTRRFGNSPENSIVYRVEECRQEAVIMRIWKSGPRGGLHRFHSQPSPLFRDEVFRGAGIDRKQSVGSIRDFKDQTRLLEEFEEKIRIIKKQ